MTGRIERVVEETGSGFIAGDDGQDYRFHRSALAPGEPFDQLLRGAAVAFEIAHAADGRRAEHVRVLPRLS